MCGLPCTTLGARFVSAVYRAPYRLDTFVEFGSIEGMDTPNNTPNWIDGNDGPFCHPSTLPRCEDSMIGDPPIIDALEAMLTQEPGYDDPGLWEVPYGTSGDAS